MHTQAHTHTQTRWICSLQCVLQALTSSGHTPLRTHMLPALSLFPLAIGECPVYAKSPQNAVKNCECASAHLTEIADDPPPSRYHLPSLEADSRFRWSWHNLPSLCRFVKQLPRYPRPIIVFLFEIVIFVEVRNVSEKQSERIRMKECPSV